MKYLMVDRFKYFISIFNENYRKRTIVIREPGQWRGNVKLPMKKKEVIIQSSILITIVKRVLHLPD